MAPKSGGEPERPMATKEELDALRAELNQLRGQLDRTEKKHDDHVPAVQEQFKTLESLIHATVTQSENKLNADLVLIRGDFEKHAAEKKTNDDARDKLIETIMADLSSYKVDQANKNAAQDENAEAIILAATQFKALQESTNKEIFDDIRTFKFEQQRLDAAQDARADAQDKFMEVTRARQDKLLQDNTVSMTKRMDDIFTQLRSDTEAKFISMHTELNHYIVAVDARVSQLERDYSELQSMPVRRVEWVINGASMVASSAALECPDQPNAPFKCWHSPKFMASGLQDLQMELQLFSPSSSDGVDDGDRNTECMLKLTGPKATTVLVRLYVGKAWLEVLHTFDNTTSLFTKRCNLKKQIQSSDDTLRIGIEILEVFHTVFLESETLHGRSGSCMVETTATGINVPVSLPGSLCFHKHVCIGAVSRHMEKIQSQIDLMQSRLISRIEWHLEDVSSMQLCIPQGQCICSAPFMLAGAEGLQFVFFPSGDKGASSCTFSLYVYYPGRTSLQCWLTAGKQNREAEPCKKGRSGLFGRLNFALLQGCIDKKYDSLTLGLEIAEAQEHGTELLSYEPAPRAVPWTNLATGIKTGYPVEPFSGMSHSQSMASLSEGDEYAIMHTAQHSSHTTRLQGQVGRLALGDTKQLPSIWSTTPGRLRNVEQVPPIWTFKPRVEEGSVPNGFYSYSQMPRPAPDDPRLLKLKNPVPEPGVERKGPHSARVRSARGELSRITSRLPQL
jgi:hypothetical protein